MLGSWDRLNSVKDASGPASKVGLQATAENGAASCGVGSEDGTYGRFEDEDNDSVHSLSDEPFEICPLPVRVGTPADHESDVSGALRSLLDSPEEVQIDGVPQFRYDDPQGHTSETSHAAGSFAWLVAEPVGGLEDSLPGLCSYVAAVVQSSGHGRNANANANADFGGLVTDCYEPQRTVRFRSILSGGTGMAHSGSSRRSDAIALPAIW